jgi:hypothetical protein
VRQLLQLLRRWRHDERPVQQERLGKLVLLMKDTLSDSVLNLALIGLMHAIRGCRRQNIK